MLMRKAHHLFRAFNEKSSSRGAKESVNYLLSIFYSSQSMRKHTSVPEKIIYIIMIGTAGLLDGAGCLCGAAISVILARFDI